MSSMKSLDTKLISAVFSSITTHDDDVRTKLVSTEAADKAEEDGWTTVRKKKRTKQESQLVIEEMPMDHSYPIPSLLVGETEAVSSKQAQGALSHKAQLLPTPGKAKLSKSAKRNMRRSRKRQEARQNQVGSTMERTPTDKHEPTANALLSLPYSVVADRIVSLLGPGDISHLAQTCKEAKRIAEEGYLWRRMFKDQFPSSDLSQTSIREWKLAYQLTLSRIVEQLRCASTKRTFFEDVLGVGVDYTINPRSKSIDYIELSQDLISQTAFIEQKHRFDVFDKEYKLFLPLYFSGDHFKRALPRIRATLQAMSSTPDSSRFNPSAILDIFPKIVTTFSVLLSDEGVSASKKSFEGLTRVHRLFMALVHEYPQVKTEALERLKRFNSSEKHRIKATCPNLGLILPLLLVVDEDQCTWKEIRASYLAETFDRSVLWVCKKYPRLQNVSAKVPESDIEQRIELTRQAMTVNLRLLMFNVSFLKMSCPGSTQERARKYDLFFGQSDCTKEVGCVLQKGPQSFSLHNFRERVNAILTANSWGEFYECVGASRPKSRAAMAELLRSHVKSSEAKGYHKQGMDYSRVQRSGTSRILAKGQEYSASKDLKRVTFFDSWSFSGSTKYLDASCLMYNKGKKLVSVPPIDYSNTTSDDGSVDHSGDVMRNGGGQHTIDINLETMHPSISTCVFVLSAWASATLADIISPTISFKNSDNDEVLCSYNLDSHDKVSHLTSIVMCKLYRSSRTGGWHVQAIGESHGGAADNYGPIFDAVEKML